MDNWKRTTVNERNLTSLENRSENQPYMLQDPRYRITPMQQMLSACIGGLITTLVVTPLDVIKTRLQTQHTTRQQTAVKKLCYVFHNGLMTHVCKPETTECLPDVIGEQQRMRPSRGAIDAFVKILCNDGFLALWSGLSPTLVSALPSTMIYFVTYDYLKNFFTDVYYSIGLRLTNKTSGNNSEHHHTINRPIPFIVPMLSGVSARSFVVTAVTPIEMVRVKMQSQYMTYAQIMTVVKNLVAAQGVRGLWRGLPPTLMRDAPFSGMYWASYEMLKRIFNVTEPTFTFSFITGAVSGTVATMVTMPFDLITTHTQIELGEDVLYSDNSNKTARRISVFERLSYIYRKEGLGGLYVGMLPRLMRVVPACAIMISTFEYSKSFFFSYNSKQEAATG